MSLGQQINRLRGLKGQKAVAADFQKKVTHPSARGWSHDTVVSSLSRLENDRPEGVRFFFADLVCGHALLDALEVTDEDSRRLLLEQAQQALQMQQDRAPRLYVDLTAFECGGDAATALFDKFKETFLDPRWQQGLQPILLHITERQFDRLPRSFDDLGDALRTVRKAPASLPSSALLCTASLCGPFERWLAIHYRENAGFELGPPDGLSRFLSEGQLDSLPAIEAPLPPCAVAEQAPSLPGSAPERRLLMRQLSSAEDAARLGMTATQRALLAQALGIQGTFTVAERIEQEITEIAGHLGLSPETTDEQGLQAILARAARRPGPPRLLRIGDALHLVNDTTTLQPGLVSLVTHSFSTPPVPILTQLLDELDGWTIDDIYLDPYLHEVESKLASKTGEPALVMHACNTVSLAAAYPAWRELGPVENWLEVLRALLAAPMPTPECFVDRDEIPRFDEGRSGMVWRSVLPSSDGQPAQHRLVYPRSVLPLGDRLHFERVVSSSLALLYFDGRTMSPLHHRQGVPTMVYDLREPRDVDAWLDQVDASSAVGGEPRRDGRGQLLPPRSSVTVDIQTIEAPQLSSDELFVMALDAWESLRDAASLGRASALPDGRAALRLNPSVTALLTSRKRPPNRKAATCLAVKIRLECVRDYHGRIDIRSRVQARLPLMEVGGYQGGPLVPVGIYLANEHAAFEITFVGTPLLGSGSSPSAMLGMAAMEAARLEELRRSSDDD